MIRIPYENLDRNQLRARNYMRSILRGGYQPGLEVLPRAALLKGYPVQDVWAAALSFYQNGMDADAIAAEPVPAALRKAFVAHVRQMNYVPSPIDTAHVAMTPQMQTVVDAAARAIHENWRERRTAEGLTSADNPLLRPWEDLSPEDRSSTLSTAEEAVKALAAIGGVSAADLDFRRTRDELCARLDEHVHDVWAQNKAAAGVRYGVERTKDAEGRDITHPDLVPFKDLSEASKSYNHDIDVIILDAIHKENLNIVPQVKDAVAIDTSHVKMTDALRKAAEKVAKTEHAMHLDAEPFEESPVMKPWEDLDPADRQMMLDEAGEKLMLVAAIGGLSPETFGDRESVGEICGTLDDFVMAREGRTDRELVHAENEVFLQAVEASGIVVEAQMSRDVEDMERKMKDAFRKEPALEPELPGAAEKAARILAEVRLYELESAPRPGAALPPEDHLAASGKMFDAAEGAILRCADGFICPEDTLVETPEGNFVCIIPKGAAFEEDALGNLDMSPFETAGINFLDFECRQACLKAIHGMLSENGYAIDPLALKDPDYPMTLDNLHDDALAERLLSDARREVKALEERGFVMIPGYTAGRGDGDVLSGNLGRLLAEGPLDGRSVEALSRAGLWVSYTRSDEAVIKAIHDDRAWRKREDRRFMVRNDPKSEEREWSHARSEISYLFMEGNNRPVKTPEDLVRRAAAFREKMKDPLSKESVLMDSLPLHGDRDAQVAEAFRTSSWMAMTGCSYNDAVAMVTLPKERFRLPQGAMAAVERYKEEKAAYDNKNFVAKLFSREPKMDPRTLQSLEDKLNDMKRDWKTYSDIEGAVRGIGLLGQSHEYLDGIHTMLAKTLERLDVALDGVLGMEAVRDRARDMSERAGNMVDHARGTNVFENSTRLGEVHIPEGVTPIREKEETVIPERKDVYDDIVSACARAVEAAEKNGLSVKQGPALDAGGFAQAAARYQQTEKGDRDLRAFALENAMNGVVWAVDPEKQIRDVRVLREYGIPEHKINEVLLFGKADFSGSTHNRPSTETSPADPRLDVKTSMHMEVSGSRIVVKDPVGRDMKVGDFLKMGYRDLLAKKPEKKVEPKLDLGEKKGPKIK